MSLSRESDFLCPYCGSSNSIILDASEGKHFDLVTDCSVCCRPVVVQVSFEDGDYNLHVRAEND